MKTPADPLSRLPELPVELFELSAKLDYSETAPVITNRPDIVTAKPPVISTPRIVRSSHQVRIRYCWAIYPKVVCYPFNDLVAVAALNLNNSKPGLRDNETDLGAIAGARRYYKLSRFRGQDLATAFGCEVRYGPWFAKVTETESCDDQIPDMWQLESQDPGIALQWLGSWDDRPSVPNLQVVMDLNSIASVSNECCPGHYYCPTTHSCVPNAVDCQDAHPV